MTYLATFLWFLALAPAVVTLIAMVAGSSGAITMDRSQAWMVVGMAGLLALGWAASHVTGIAVDRGAGPGDWALALLVVYGGLFLVLVTIGLLGERHEKRRTRDAVEPEEGS